MRPGCPWKMLRPGPKGHVEQESPVPSLLDLQPALAAQPHGASPPGL